MRTVVAVVTFFQIFSFCILSTKGDLVRLASCPQGVDGEEEEYSYINNGVECIRERIVLTREVVDAECPSSEYTLKAGKCRKHLHSSIPATCPDGYIRQGDYCYKKCPSKAWRQKYYECWLSQKTLPAKYMICPEGQHRYDAFCCTIGEDCPAIQCQISGVPGQFLYIDGVCQRKGHAMVMTMYPKPNQAPCPENLISVWGICQEPCPPQYRPSKGKCELLPCTFDPMTQTIVKCPEGDYLAQRSIF